MKKRINHNNLLPWFTQDHGTLPASYLASCEKFFRALGKKRKKPQASSSKHQASSLTGPVGDDRMNIERNNMDKEIEDRSVNPLIRIANALEEILRLVKEDQEKMRKISEKN